jgi:Rod binding domain-containing protein
MNSINSINSINLQSATASMPAAPSAKGGDNPAVRKAFDQFVGQTFYGEMLKQMRKSQGKIAYMNGGQAEEIFTQQLDQMLNKKMSDTSAHSLSGPMYKLFTHAQK